MSLLSIKNLKKSKGNSVLFSNFNLEIDKGDIIALKCNNEVGQLLIKMFIGEIPLSNGEILFQNEPLYNNYKKFSRNIGIAFLEEKFYERLNTYQYLKFFKQIYEIEADIDALLHKVELFEKRKTKIKNLNFSEKKRLQVARVILPQPDLIIFEELNHNLDIESQLIIQQVITDWVKQNKSVLITTNYFENAILLTDVVYSLDKEGLKRIEVADSLQENIEEQEISPVSTQIHFEKIPAKVNDKIILFDPTEISFIESNEGVSNLHVNGEVFPCSYTLNELFNRLQAFGFFRSHRSYIVNLQRVREVITWTRNSYSLVLDDVKKSSIPLSKGKLGELKEIIGL
ncbi:MULTISPECIES: LytTR family transcriptional regulator DNA-binding domain-containing protein [Priestia]|uniref:LytTR family transcriptional regulator DNA-binding domain-containing protein n=1 Tax=Priestia TaxID=2800373 RepID=UPI001951249C|nr:MULTISPECIES: LytTR family transcriptional regulator DNA-binding domain-containing protein [Priestia]MBM6601931.1 LytTR family transcriptional regulator DNA-binding domain-containing protein [Priestia megaterium]MCG0049718.1 LytTR family transcriptional regulator DNA-binding domain-containing protein [Priestia aryabhattai]